MKNPLIVHDDTGKPTTLTVGHYASHSRDCINCGAQAELTLPAPQPKLIDASPVIKNITKLIKGRAMDDYEAGYHAGLRRALVEIKIELGEPF